MVLGVMEGQIRGGYFPDYIFDPSVVDCTAHIILLEKSSNKISMSSVTSRAPKCTVKCTVH